MKKNMAGLILVLFVIALFMTGCEKKAQEKEEAQEASARQLVIQKQTQTEIAEKKIEEKRRELPNQAQIEMEVILQKPELPTGCESVALTMVLKQKGYPIEKTTIAEEYLIYNRDNYASGYVGDPSTYGGVGIYPPGLVNTANCFLKQRYQQHTAYDVSKLSLEELLPYVAAGNPVLLWLTSDLEAPYFSSQSVEYGGDSYRWYWNEHCVVLGGYDLEKQSVTLFDPLKGKAEESLERVEEIYNQTGKYAMTVY